MDALTSINNSRGKVYYFQLSSNKVKDFKKCFPVLKDEYSKFIFERNNRIFIRFQWELIVLFASKKQLIEFDKFRQGYINDLLKKHCNIEATCVYRKIGSNSPKSDIDINMRAPHIEKIITDIIKEHNSNFADTLEDMFDTNLYGITIRYLNCSNSPECYPNYTSTIKQRTWSFLRIAEVVQENPNLENTFSPIYKSLLDRSMSLLISLQNKYKFNRYRHYSAALKRFYKEKNKRHPDPDKLIEKLSLSKYFEKDTYRSGGAVLHIVEKKLDIDVDKLYDSVYDNYGFLLSVLMKKSICSDKNINAKIMKVSKYISRICEAIQEIGNKKQLPKHPYLMKVWELADSINKKRKGLVNISLITPEIDKLMKFMEHSDIVLSMNDFFLDTLLPKDEMLNHFNSPKYRNARTP